MNMWHLCKTFFERVFKSLMSCAWPHDASFLPILTMTLESHLHRWHLKFWFFIHRSFYEKLLVPYLTRPLNSYFTLKMFTKVGISKENIMSVLLQFKHNISYSWKNVLDLTAFSSEFFSQYLNFRNVSKSEGLFSEVWHKQEDLSRLYI